MAKTQARDDPYAKGSFTLRGMARWQRWSITVVSALIVIGLLAYALTL